VFCKMSALQFCRISFENAATSKAKIAILKVDELPR